MDKARYTIRNLNSLFLVLDRAAKDIRHIHFRVVGKEFDTMHKITDEMYHQLLDDADKVYELALQNADIADDKLYSKALLDDTGIRNVRYFPYAKAIFGYAIVLDYVISALNMALNLDISEGQRSVLSELLSKYEKELYYKTKMRAIPLTFSNK